MDTNFTLFWYVNVIMQKGVLEICVKLVNGEVINSN